MDIGKRLEKRLLNEDVKVDKYGVKLYFTTNKSYNEVKNILTKTLKEKGLNDVKIVDIDMG
jgi:hypothetical protein